MIMLSSHSILEVLQMFLGIAGFGVFCGVMILGFGWLFKFMKEHGMLAEDNDTSDDESQSSSSSYSSSSSSYSDSEDDGVRVEIKYNYKINGQNFTIPDSKVVTMSYDEYKSLLKGSMKARIAYVTNNFWSGLPVTVSDVTVSLK